jgi:hypothetical protein
MTGNLVNGLQRDAAVMVTTDRKRGSRIQRRSLDGRRVSSSSYECVGMEAEGLDGWKGASELVSYF